MVTNKFNADYQNSDQFETRIHTPSLQPSLFKSEELIVPASLSTLKKSVAAIHSISDQSQTLNNMRLFNACILVAHLDFKARKDLDVAKVRSELITPVFEIRITELAKLAGIPGKNFERVYEELNHLLDMKMQWNMVGEDGTIEMGMKAPFLTLLGIGKANTSKRGLIRFSIETHVLVNLLEPAIWASLSLSALHSFKSKSSYSLFEKVFKYLGTQRKLTADLATDLWIKLILGPSRFVKEENGEVKVNYKDFKRFHLVPAIEEINAHPALAYTIELLEKKRGNRVASLQFGFHKKVQQNLELPIAWSGDTLNTLKFIGLNEEEILDFSQSNSLARVLDAIEVLRQQETKLKAKGQRIGSRKAYFLGILKNLGDGVDGASLNAQELEKSISEMQEAELATQRRERQQKAFAAHQHEVFVRNMFTRPDFTQLIETFSIANENSDVIKRFIKNGVDESNVPLMQMIKHWIKENKPHLLGDLLPLPQDQNIEDWLSWKLDTSLE